MCVVYRIDIIYYLITNLQNNPPFLLNKQLIFLQFTYMYDNDYAEIVVRTRLYFLNIDNHILVNRCCSVLAFFPDYQILEVYFRMFLHYFQVVFCACGMILDKNELFRPNVISGNECVLVLLINYYLEDFALLYYRGFYLYLLGLSELT